MVQVPRKHGFRGLFFEIRPRVMLGQLNDSFRLNLMNMISFR